MRGFILLKPEAVQRNLVGKIISMLEDKGLKIIALKMLTATRKQIEDLYGHLHHEPHYSVIIDCCLDGPVVALALETPVGVDAAQTVTDLQGKFDVAGTVRYYFASHPSRSVLHCSDTGKGDREISIFFNEEELNTYNKILDDWIVAKHYR